MQICPKCGSRIPDDAEKCSACEELDIINKLDRDNYKKISRMIYCSVVAFSIFFAVVFITEEIRECMYELRNYPKGVNIPEMLISHILLPLAFGFFLVMIIVSERSKLMQVLPITGLSAEAVKLVSDLYGYYSRSSEKSSYIFGLMVTSLFSAVFAAVFLCFLLRMIRRDFNISQSRMLIVGAFVVVFSRIILKITLFDDPVISRDIFDYSDGSKVYMLFAAALLNVKKRYRNSQNR